MTLIDHQIQITRRAINQGTHRRVFALKPKRWHAGFDTEIEGLAQLHPHTRQCDDPAPNTRKSGERPVFFNVGNAESQNPVVRFRPLEQLPRHATTIAPRLGHNVVQSHDI